MKVENFNPNKVLEPEEDNPPISIETVTSAVTVR